MIQISACPQEQLAFSISEPNTFSLGSQSDLGLGLLHAACVSTAKGHAGAVPLHRAEDRTWPRGGHLTDGGHLQSLNGQGLAPLPEGSPQAGQALIGLPPLGDA